tara:strand:+ start:1625 stop:1984 length:360 start_codon:yes stop_codon:yes gene_type:complete
MLYTVTEIWEREYMKDKFSYYLQVEQKLRATNRIEKVWIHPFSIPEGLDTSTVNVGDKVEITDKRFEYANIHAVACRCSKCSAIFKEILEAAENKGTAVINTHGKKSDEVATEVRRLAK